MAGRLLVAAAAALSLTGAAASPAAAQVPSRTYDCTASDGWQLTLIIGDGEVQFLEDGKWSGNLCAASDPCRFNGSVFQVMAEDWDIKFNASDGSVVFAVIGYEQEFAGTCRAR